MKRTLMISICCVLLLTGCNGGNTSFSENSTAAADSSLNFISEEIPERSTEEAENISAPSEETSETAPPEAAPNNAESSEAAEESAETSEVSETAEPTDDIEKTVPTLSGGEVRLTQGETLDLEKIKAEQGYDLDCDYESDEYYQKRRADMESTLSGEQLEEYRRRNFFHEMSAEPFYLGSDTADWLVIVDYSVSAMFGQYQQILYVKNNKIVRKSEVLPFGVVSGWAMSGNELICMTAYGSLCIYNIGTGELKSYTEDSEGNSLVDGPWNFIYGMNDDHILFGNGTVWAYDRHTEKIRATPVNLCQDLEEYSYLDDSSILYYREWDGDSGRYDLKTGENISEDVRYISETGDFIIEMFRPSVHDVYDLSRVKLTRKSDGAEKVFDLSGYFDRTMYLDMQLGDWLVGAEYALNFESEELAPVELEGDFNYYALSEAEDRVFCANNSIAALMEITLPAE